MEARGQTLAKIALALLLAHLAFGIARIPSRVYGQRLDEIEAYRSQGATRRFLDDGTWTGATAIEQILADSPADAVVLWRGEWKGSFEFAPGLLAPRLLVAEDEIPADAGEFAGRPLARLADGSVLVLVSRGDSLEIQPR